MAPGRLPTPGQRPPGHHRRPLGPSRRRSRPQAPRDRQQRRLRRVLALPPRPRTPPRPPATLRRRHDPAARLKSAVTPREPHPSDFTTADGRIFLQINLMMAEYFRERTKESWASSLAYAVGRGVHIAPGLPYGYVKDESKRLVPDHRAPFALAAFEQRANGGPFQRIAEWLNDEAPPRPDGRPWVATSVERMIRRRVYKGVAHWGDEENPDAHPAIVDDDLWRAAQVRVQTHPAARRRDDIALLHGIARCAGCRFQLSRAQTTSSGKPRDYYRCRVHRVSGGCEAPAAVRADRDDGLEAYVERVVRAELDRRAGRYLDVSDSGAFQTASRNSSRRATTWNRCGATRRRADGSEACGCRSLNRSWRPSRSRRNASSCFALRICRRTSPGSPPTPTNRWSARSERQSCEP
jgi:hypothetical protein